MLRLFNIENRPKEADGNKKEMLEFKEKQRNLRYSGLTRSVSDEIESVQDIFPVRDDGYLIDTFSIFPIHQAVDFLDTLNLKSAKNSSQKYQQIEEKFASFYKGTPA